MHTSAVEMVVVDLMASQHETVETQVVNKHFFKLNALLTHVLVIDNLVRHFSVAASI